MRARAAIGSCLLVIAAVGYAEEVEPPKFSSAPIEYASRYGGRLLIGDKTPKELKFWFNVPGANHHQCHMAGTAKAEDPETYVLIERNCRLQIRVLPQA